MVSLGVQFEVQPITAGTACQQELEAAGDSMSPVGEADREEHCYSAGFSVFHSGQSPDP